MNGLLRKRTWNLIRGRRFVTDTTRAFSRQPPRGSLAVPALSSHAHSVGSAVRAFTMTLQHSRFLKNISIVMAGTGVAQGIGFATAPIISRLFSPADFGALGSFNAVLSVVAAFVTLQYSQALMLPDRDEDAANVFAASLVSVCIVSLASLLAAYLFSDWLLGLLKAPPQSTWLLWFLPFCIFIAGMSQSLQAWCIRRKAFTKTAVSQVVRTGSASVLQIASGLLGHGGAGLITSSTVGCGIASAGLLRQVLAIDKALLKGAFDWRQVGKQAGEYRDFPIYSATQHTMNAMSQGLPILLLAHFYGLAVSGAYAFGLRLLHVPMGFVLTALRQVLFQKACEMHNQGECLSILFLKTTAGLVVASLLPGIVLFVWAPDIFSGVFGGEWREAGIFARWLTLWLSVAFCNVPANLFARILRQQKGLFLYECIVLLSRSGILLIGGLCWSAHRTIVAFSVMGSLLNIGLIMWVGALLFCRGERCQVFEPDSL